MSFVLKVLSILAVLAFAAALNEPAFVQTFQKLQQGPPIPLYVNRSIPTAWITQKLDHFNGSEERTWKQRYMINDKYYEVGGPMFIYVGGEWSISAASISTGMFLELAQAHKGIVFYTEHRYYGESKPTDDLSVENLKYLNVKQALADLAHFIEYKRDTVPALATSKVIMAGGAYAGSLVILFKKLYPELIAGGWASSAPLEARVDFLEYKEVVGQVFLELDSEKCYNRIRNGIAELEAMFASKRSAEAKAMLKLCNNFDHNNDLDLWSLFGSLSNIFGGIAQYQTDGDIARSCNLLESFEDDLTAISVFWLNHFGLQSGCIDASYQSTLDYYSQTSYDNGAMRPWYYQTCNEFGWYQSSSSQKQPFGTKFPTTLYTSLCADIFGDIYSNEFINALVAATNETFSGMNFGVDKIFMTQGSLDPWLPMGHGLDQGAAVIPLGSHCSDFAPYSPNDEAGMRAVKERLMESVRQWLV